MTDNLIENFYQLYPEFQLFFYKLFNKDLSFKKNSDYLDHYHHTGLKENRIISFKMFIEVNKIDLNFVKIFYKEFNCKEGQYIIKEMIKNNYSIISEESFHIKYPYFNIHIYKIYNFNKIKHFVIYNVYINRILIVLSSMQ